MPKPKPAAAVDRAEMDVKATARLYECRDALRFLHGAKYDALVQPWKDGILSRLDPGGSVLSYVINAADFHKDDVVTIWLMAAAVEIISNQRDCGGRITIKEGQ
jgi:hypothetical protein